MADLKAKADAIVASIGSETERAIGRLRDVGEEVAREVQETARALDSIQGRQATDLMLMSSIALARDVVIEGRGARLNMIELRLANCNYNLCQPYGSGSEELPPGKYRALFFLLPVED